MRFDEWIGCGASDSCFRWSGLLTESWPLEQMVEFAHYGDTEFTGLSCMMEMDMRHDEVDDWSLFGSRSYIVRR